MKEGEEDEGEVKEARGERKSTSGGVPTGVEVGESWG